MGYRIAWVTGILLLLLMVAFALSMQQNLWPALWVNGPAQVFQTPEAGQGINEMAEQVTAPDSDVQNLASREIVEQPVKPLTIDKKRSVEQKIAENKKPEKIEVSTLEIKQQPVVQNLPVTPKKIQQSSSKLDKVIENQAVVVSTSSERSEDFRPWLEHKIELSKEWLRDANTQGVSIQVMVTKQSAARELVNYLKTQWPLELDKTYVYPVELKERTIFRVFYGEFPSITEGQETIKQLPRSVRINSPYLHSVNRMQKALL
jgi:septal ring-binding cell division protein DamX